LVRCADGSLFRPGGNTARPLLAGLPGLGRTARPRGDCPRDGRSAAARAHASPLSGPDHRAGHLAFVLANVAALFSSSYLKLLAENNPIASEMCSRAR